MSKESFSHEDLQNMELHETMKIDANKEVMKVPGGWVYIFKRSVSDALTSTFVPDRSSDH